MTIVYHATSAANAAEILDNGFEGGWGDAGFGVYFYRKLYNAMAYLNDKGWDGKLDPDTAVIVSVDVDEAELDMVVPDPGWPNPEDYEDVAWYPMDPDAGNIWKPRMQIAYPAPEADAQWNLHATVLVGGSERSVWRYDAEDGREVYQMTEGDLPSSMSGYHLLDSLLSLKGVRPCDLVISEPAISAQSPKP